MAAACVEGERAPIQPEEEEAEVAQEPEEAGMQQAPERAEARQESEAEVAQEPEEAEMQQAPEQAEVRQESEDAQMASSGLGESETPRGETASEARQAPDMLATQVMFPLTQGAEQAATQMMLPAEPSMLATQVMLPADTNVEAAVAAAAAPAAEVEFQKPAARKQLVRPKSAYQIFALAMRKKVCEEIGSTKLAQVQGALAKKWASLEESEKALYTKQAKEEKETYDKELADGGIPASKKKAAGKKAGGKKPTAAAKRAARLRILKKRVAAGPKKPRSSYSLWLAENRKVIRNKLMEEGSATPSFEEIARAAGKTWLALTDAQKAPYVERSHALSAKYKDLSKACKEYKKANVRDTKVKAKAKAKKAGKNSGSKSSDAVKRVATPQKSSSAAAKSAAKPSPPKKAKKESQVKTVYLDMSLVAEAEKASMAGAFQKLAEREDMRPFPQRKLLDALVASGGLLHRAKDAILSSAA